MSALDRVIRAHGAFEILDAQQVVPLYDGTRCVLHRVRHQGSDTTFLRAILADGVRWAVFDLRVLTRAFDADLRALLPRDHDGVVHFTLRLTFSTAAEIEECAVFNPVEIWWDDQADKQLELWAA